MKERLGATDRLDAAHGLQDEGMIQMEYGTREFGLHDPDGCLLAFAEESA